MRVRSRVSTLERVGVVQKYPIRSLAFEFSGTHATPILYSRYLPFGMVRDARMRSECRGVTQVTKNNSILHRIIEVTLST